MPRRYGWSPTTNGRRTHDAFLDEKSTYTDGTVADRRQHLVKVERMVRKRIREKRLFTFLEPPEGCGTTIPATNNLIGSWNARIRDMPPSPRAEPDPPHQGGGPVAPPTHPAASTSLMACGQRDHEPADRGTLRTGLGEKPAGCARDLRHPQPVGRRHRLERIPHQRPPPHRHRMGPHPQTHILAYNPAFPILDIQIKKVKLGATEP
ncbi:Uncharacterised protein [Bifidobacterium breve]|uniref:Uncharacterized protein n=1 Tax=Bifidobacterium breve TaxID=1685 RepID=A0A6N2TLR2_BIFBR|nr:hypothetical protein HMPREF1482_01948 [Bifidobacterium breve HPH0326]